MDNPWQDYLDHLTDKGLTPIHAEAVRSWWKAATSFLPGLPRPSSAGLGGYPNFAIDWDTPVLHVDVQLATDGTWEWFYSFRDHEEFGGTGDVPEPPLTDTAEEPAVIRYLRIATLGFFTGTQLDLSLGK